MAVAKIAGVEARVLPSVQNPHHFLDFHFPTLSSCSIPPFPRMPESITPRAPTDVQMSNVEVRRRWGVDEFDSDDDLQAEMCPFEAAQSTPRGFICEPYTLYQTLPDTTGRTSWSEQPPKIEIQTVDVSKSNKYALIVRKVKCYDGNRDFELHSIETQSEVLKKFLAGVMDGYAGLTMTLRTVKFKPPFQPFVHRWEQLNLARNGDLDEETKAHVDLLYDILEEEVRETVSRKNDLLSNGVISYDMIWALFHPGATVFSVVNSRPRIFARLVQSDYRGGSIFEMKAEYVDSDGEKFGYEVERFRIVEFHGTVPITSLQVFPLAYHSDRATLCEDLIARGKLWQTFKGYHFKHYEGPIFQDARGHGGRKINSRIIIDAAAYSLFTGILFLNGERSLEEMSNEDLMLATPILRG